MQDRASAWRVRRRASIAAMVVLALATLLLLVGRLSCDHTEDDHLEHNEIDFVRSIEESSTAPAVAAKDDLVSPSAMESFAAPLAVEVVDVTDRPLPDAWIISIEAENLRGRRWLLPEEIIVRTDAAGRATVDRRRLSPRSDGRAGVAIGAGGFVSSHVEVLPGASKIRVRLDAGATFSGIVTVTDGTLLSGATITLSRIGYFPEADRDLAETNRLLPGDHLPVHVGRSDERGRVRICGIEPGEYRLIASHEDYGFVMDDPSSRVVIPGPEHSITMAAIVASVLRFEHGNETIMGLSTYLEGFSGNPTRMVIGESECRQRLEKRFPGCVVGTRSIGGRSLDLETDGSPWIEFLALFSDGVTHTARVPVRAPSQWAAPDVARVPESEADAALPLRFDLIQPTGEVFRASDLPFFVGVPAAEGRPRLNGRISIGDGATIRLPRGEFEIKGIAPILDRCLENRLLSIDGSTSSPFEVRLLRRLVSVEVRIRADFDLRGHRPLLKFRGDGEQYVRFVGTSDHITLPAGEWSMTAVVECARAVERTIEVGGSGDAEEISVDFHFDDEVSARSR